MRDIPVISELAQRATQSINHILKILAKASSYEYGRAGFFSAVFIVALSTIGVVVGEAGFVIQELSILVQNPENGFFSSSLNLILSIISLVFIVVIFLVQNATQEYSSRLSSVIFQDRYFLATIGFILIASIFSISGSYFDWESPLTVIGYAFSIATVLLVASLIAFTGYFISISNIVEYISQRIEKEIATERIYRPAPFRAPLQDEDYIGQLSNDTQLIVSTCIKAIEANQQTVVDACLTSLTKIVEKYLEQTTKQDVNEDFLKELNDQFQFIGSAAFEDYSRQKYSESVVETIGDIGIAVTNSRELGAQGSSWANLLTRLFEDSLEFDRTAAASISIQKLGEMSVTAIKNGDFDSCRVYQGEFEKISVVCSAGNHAYLASLLQTVHGQYQQMYPMYLYALLESGYAPDYDVSSLLEEFANSFNRAKSTYGNYTRQILYAGLFGLSPFAGAIASQLVQYQNPDLRTQRYLSEYLQELVEFLQKISLVEPESNHQDIYKGYTQFLFVFEQCVPLEDDAKLELISQLNDVWIELIGSTYRIALNSSENIDHGLNDRISDFTAFIIYFYRDDPEATTELIEPLAEIYLNLSEGYSDSDQYAEINLRRLYKQLKLAGAWVNRFHEPESVTPILWDVLKDNFYEIPENRSRIPRSIMEKHGYPTSTSFHYKQGWWLRPDSLWSYTGFQEEITETLNGEDGTNYAGLHERLKNS